MEKAKQVLSRSMLLKRLAVAACCILLCVGVLHAEPITVTGTVTSASDGEPLIGVSVMLEGSTELQTGFEV